MAEAQVYNLVATASFSQQILDENGVPQIVTYNAGDVIQSILWDGEAPVSFPENTQAVLPSASNS